LEGIHKGDSRAIASRHDSSGAGARCKEAISGDGTYSRRTEPPSLCGLGGASVGTWRGQFDGSSYRAGRSTVYHGLSDIRERASAPPARIRKEGGARKNPPSSDRTPPARAPGEPQSNQRRVRWNQVAPGLAVFYRVRGFVPLTPNGH